MGLRVTAAQAAWLTGHGERMVRWHIQTRKDLPAVKVGRSWAIDVDALEAIPGWRVNRERLAEMEAADARSAASMVARIAELERQMRDLRARLARLEASASVALQTSRSEGQQMAWGDVGAMPTSLEGGNLPGGPLDALQSMSGIGAGARRGLSPDARSIETLYGPPPVSLADRGAGAPLRFKTKTDAARWLVRHGVNSESTPKTWRGWPPDELTPLAALTFTLDVWRDARARGDWRVTWALHRCDDGACVCHDMLTD